MKQIILILFTVAFYFQANIAGLLGIRNKYIVYVLYGLCLIALLFKKEHFRFSAEIFIVLGAATMLVYRYFAHMFNGSFISASFIILPALMVYVIPHRWDTSYHKNILKTLQQFIYIFYILECIIAIFELITHHYLFGYAENSYDTGVWRFTSTGQDFRAVSICGAPLSNSLIVLTINIFILFSSLPIRKKIFCYLIGLVAVFAFNARVSIVLFIESPVFYYLRNLKRGSFIRNTFLLGLLSAVTLVIIYWASNMGAGTRFLGTNLEDDSSIAVRLRLFDYFSSASLKDYLWGLPMQSIGLEMEDIGVAVIENFWIGFMMLFGLVPLVYFTICYFFLGKSLFRGYSKYSKVTLSLFFIVNASINNSLYSNYAALMTFLICIIVFNQSTALSKDK